jgi:glycosyltransferase involved in cell wall biosynthesis
MDQRPLVSVVIPTYQRRAVLEEAIRSVLAQTYERFEVLVEDDGSTDGTAEMVAGLGDPRVRYAWAPNKGYPAPVRNAAVRRAKGELVAFLDSDDVWLPEKLEKQVTALLRDASLLGVSCRSDTLPPTARKVTLVADDRPSFAEVLRHGGGILNSGTVLRREILDAVGLLDEDRAVRAVEDFDLWLRVLARRDRSILVLADRLFLYRQSEDAITSRDERVHLERVARVIRKHEATRPDLVREALAHRELLLRRGELLRGLRDGSLPLGRWLTAPEVPLRRRLRLAAKSLFLGRSRA